MKQSRVAFDSDRHILYMAVWASEPYPLIITTRITCQPFNQTLIQKGCTYDAMEGRGNICEQDAKAEKLIAAV